MIRRLGAVACLMAGLPLLPAVRADGGVRVRAEIEPRGTITDETQVQLVISVEGSSSVDVDTLELPDMTNLRVLSGPYTSRQTSMSMVNGSFTSQTSVTMTYTLLPLRPGPAEVPAFDIRVGATTYRTEPLRFQIVKGGGGPPARGGARPAPGAIPPQEGDDEVGGEVSLESRLSAATVWVGQPVLLETTLYAGARVTGFDWIDNPAIPGVWVDTPQVDSQREATRVTRGGRAAVAYPVARKVLVPTAAGTIAIPQAVAQIQVARPPRDRFGMFFGLGSAVDLVRRTQPLVLRVRPLPEDGKPGSFAGAVGSYRMTVSTDRSRAEVGDAIAVRATVEGPGSLEAVPAPALAPPPDVKVYEPKVLTNEATGANHMSSRKTWEWVVVPLKPGALALPPVAFSYFDVDSGRYKTLHGDLPEIAVVRGTGAPDSQVARGEVQPSLRDIAFIKTLRGPLLEPAPPLTRRPWFLALLVLPALLVPAAIWAGRRRERLMTDRGFARGRRAARAAMKRLDRAARDAGGPSFHEEIGRALVDYVADRANRAAAGLTYDDLEGILAAQGLDPGLRRRYRTCLESCDFARFVPASSSGSSAADLAAEARGIVRALEAAW